MNYKLENMIKELEHRLDEKKTLKAGWERVERVHTKAGKDFKITSKNFTNCTFKPIDYLIQPDREIYISCVSSATRNYYNDSIRERVSISPYDNKKPDIDETRIITGSFGSKYYLRNADEIEQQIKERIKTLDGRIKEIESELEIISEAFETITNKMESLKKQCSSYPVDISHMLNEYIQKGWYF